MHYERLWRDHLDSPKPTSLTQMQAAALAGELYREVVAAHQQNPGRTVRRSFRQARQDE